MSNFTSEEIQDISTNFRNIARRLSKTDYSQFAANLNRFILFIDNNELITEFININNIKQFDIQQIINSRKYSNPFEISPVESEEIAFDYQLLKYAVDNCFGDFIRLCGVCYINKSGTRNDHIRDFSEHIIDPFIDYIANYLRKCYEQAKKVEATNSPAVHPSISATNSNVFISSTVGGGISNQVTIDSAIHDSASEIIMEIEKVLLSSTINNGDEIRELLGDIKSNIEKGIKPKKPILTAFKTIESGVVTLAPLVKKLIEILNT